MKRTEMCILFANSVSLNPKELRANLTPGARVLARSSSYISVCSFCLSERKVVGSALDRFGSHRGRSGRRRNGCGRSCGNAFGGYDTALHAPSTYVIEPTSLVFVCVDVERHGKFFAQLDIEVAQAILAKYTEHATLRVLLMSFNNELLRFPTVASTLGYATARLKSRNYFS